MVDGVPKICYLSFENVKNDNAKGVYDGIKTAFNWFGFLKFEDKIVGLNKDDTIVNIGQYTGLGKLIIDKTSWLELVHCFSDRNQLAPKDRFDTFLLGKIDKMLMELFYIYKKSRKWYRELKEQGKMYEKSNSKTSKS